MGAAWRGEVTPRRLRVYINGLGEDDPRHAVDGHRYTTLEQLIWLLVGEIKRMTVQTSLSLGNKKVGDKIDHPETPWTPSQNKNVSHIGDRGDLTNDQVLWILDGLSIQGREKQRGE